MAHTPARHKKLKRLLNKLPRKRHQKRKLRKRAMGGVFKTSRIVR